MKIISMVRTALALGFIALTAQSAAALTCSARVGDSGGDYAAQVFVNATLELCQYSPLPNTPDHDGHYIASWGLGVQVLFIENGNAFTPTSRSLSCSGSTGAVDGGHYFWQTFPSPIYTTSCSLTYTDPNGQAVSHSFDAHTELTYHSLLGEDVGLGHLSSFSVTTGWFERVSPTVEITGLPADLSGTTPFNATITFSEGVTGFTANDITVSGGSVTGLSGSGANYIATITPTGQVDVVVSIAAAVAQDLAGNDNLASSSATVINVTATETGALIAQFMQGRANALLANQPDLAGFLRGGAGHFNADISRDSGDLSFNSGYDAPVWARLNANWSTNSGADSTYIFGAIGGHSKFSDNLLLGGMLQFDVQSETNGAATIDGKGWLIGPYIVAKLPDQPLYFEGSILYGQTSNEISPTGTYTDSFATERWLATVGVSGLIEKDSYTLTPFLDAKYTSDAQEAYTDGLGNPIAAQSISLGQVAAGMDVSFPVSVATTLKAGVSGIWSFSEGTGAAATVIPGFEGGRGRVELGMDHQLGAGGSLSLNSFYDGVGTPDYTSYGIELMWTATF